MSRSGEGAVVPRTSLHFVLDPFEGHHKGPVHCRIMWGDTLFDEVLDALHRGARELLEFACAKETLGARPTGCG